MPKPPTSHEFSGFSATNRSVDALFMAVLLTAVGFSLQYAGVFKLWTIAVFGFLFFMSLGAHWRMRVNAEGIALFQWRFWVVPRRTHRYLLDARVAAHWTFATKSPEGLTVEDYRHRPADRLATGKRPCFGSKGHRTAPDPLIAEINRAIAEVRAGVKDPEPAARHALLRDNAQAFAMADATWTGSRVTQVTSCAPLVVDGIEIPAGSTYVWNTTLRVPKTAWMDPRRDDYLDHIDVGDEVEIVGLGTIAASSRLSFRDGQLSSIEDAAKGTFFWEDFEIDGAQPITWQAGAPTRFMLAAPKNFGQIDIAAGSRAERERVSGWKFELAGPAVLPDFDARAGDALHFDGAILTHATLERKITLGDDAIRPKQRIPLQPDGHIDLRAARRAGILEQVNAR